MMITLLFIQKKKIDDNHNFFHTFSCIDELGTSLFLT